MVRKLLNRGGLFLTLASLSAILVLFGFAEIESGAHMTTGYYAFRSSHPEYGYIPNDVSNTSLENERIVRVIQGGVFFISGILTGLGALICRFAPPRSPISQSGR